jgi:ABC-type iron transport system FetAB ATPase subunit
MNNDLQISGLRFQQRGPYTFNILAGQIAGLQGASGAGKTLLLRAISDLDSHKGEVRLGEIVCDQIPAPDWRKNVGLLPAESFWWFDSVGEHFRLLGGNTLRTLNQLGFDQDVFDWQVSRISTGEKQRLAIARLLQYSPRALLLDEPTASLDVENIERTEAVLVEYCRQQQVPLLWVSHDHTQLSRVADKEFQLDSEGILQQVREAQDGR